MYAELVDVELLHNDEVAETVSSHVDPHNPRDMAGLIQDMKIHFGRSGPEYKIRVLRRSAEIGTFAATDADS
jgi:hypothetical protein